MRTHQNVYRPATRGVRVIETHYGLCVRSLDENIARSVRRDYIRRGYSVSLMAGDDLDTVFDVYLLGDIES